MTSTDPSDPLIIKNVSKSFAGKFAVSNMSMRIGEGEIVGFLGPNGAGKTTTLRMALGLIMPDTGSVSLFGNTPGPISFGRLGFLPEERGLYKKATARESIAHMARLNGMKAKPAFEIADALMDKYGLGDAKRKKVKALSKGMAQKVQLIASIAHDPEFLILDEPFSGLDPVNQKLLEDMVREIAERGRTIIFSTHVMEHAERLCDRIVLMARGEKIFDGSTEQALSKAARTLRIELTGADNAMDWLSPFAKDIEREGEGLYHLTLKDNVDSQNVLETAIKRKAILTRFEPKRATLHDAFVTLVGGKEIAAQMEAASAEQEMNS